MSSTSASAETATDAVGTIDMKLEVVTVPVSDVERAKAFYAGLGWRVDADFSAPGGEIRGVQLTPPRSACSIHIGKGLIDVEPGSAQRMMLAVSDLPAARDDLIARGVDVGEIYESRPPGFEDIPGRSYFFFAEFRDPDGNGWLLQEISDRIPGREWAA